jgi:hypothetical protein
MKKALRIAGAVSACLALTLGVSSSMAARGGKPAPPPPVLCGCACPDGSFVITHAPDANSCPSVCETACNNTI